MNKSGKKPKYLSTFNRWLNEGVRTSQEIPTAGQSLLPLVVESALRGYINQRAAIGKPLTTKEINNLASNINNDLQLAGLGKRKRHPKLKDPTKVYRNYAKNLLKQA